MSNHLLPISLRRKLNSWVQDQVFRSTGDQQRPMPIFRQGDSEVSLCIQQFGYHGDLNVSITSVTELDSELGEIALVTTRVSGELLEIEPLRRSREKRYEYFAVIKRVAFSDIKLEFKHLV